IKIYDAETYEYLETVDIEGVSKVYNMAISGNNLYVASSTKTITVVNLTNMTRGNVITNRETDVTHVAYSPDLDGGAGGLYYGNGENLFSCNRMGLKRDTIFMLSTDVVISGTAYYDGTLYMFSQTGKKLAQLLQFDVNTETVVSTKELNDYPRIASMDGEGFMPVGLTLCVLPDSTIALGGMFGCFSKTNHFALFELLSSPSIEGYNLYRDSVKLNSEIIKGHSYEEDIFSAGTYIYTVEAVNTNGCKAMLKDVNTRVTILPIGTCEGPGRVRVSEGAHSAVLSWEVPENSNGIVGFNIYRNSSKIADKIVDNKYLDFNVDTGYYEYIVEAFYQNSCVAADTVEITIKNEGEMMPPLNVAAASETVDLGANNGEGEFNVNLTWALPYFETPLALGFSNIPYYGITLQNDAPIWAAMGWDRELLNGYEDLYVIGMEYFIGEGITRLDGFVFLNDTLVYMKQAEGISEKNWNVLLFDKDFSMDQPMEVAVGYKVAYANSESVAVVDMGPKKGYSDLISTDGVVWKTLQSLDGLDNNWCINALVVRKRDIQKIRQKNGMIDIHSPLVKRVGNAVSAGVGVPALASFTPLAPAASLAAANKTTSASIRLDGFNVYRNNEQQNSEPLTTLSYADNSIAGGSYNYKVSAVYNGGANEMPSEPVVINLQGSGSSIEEQSKETLVSTYPNPANQMFYVNGDYKSLEITDITGVVVRKYSNSSKRIDISSLPSGTYILRFVLPNSTVAVRKLVVK
ncbi:MAG: T9SS type A sorting domain-containing protein, partial [Bacteroidales bacterium]|nr:T9SS type A sorting domain-containing protein [Bacteroidales bacterium]